MFLESHITLGLRRKEQFTIHFRVLLHILPCGGEEKYLQIKANETTVHPNFPNEYVSLSISEYGAVFHGQ